MIAFFEKIFPSFDFVLKYSIPLLAYVGLSLGMVWIVYRMKVPSPYPRKLFHVLIFSGATVFQFTLGVQAVVLFGMWTSLFIVFAMIQGKKCWFFHALTRPQEAPKEKCLILLAWASTLFGGLVSNFFFPKTAFWGYWIVGWGDALAEPVGLRWGKHFYQVPFSAKRSVEGSCGVFLGSFVATVCGGWLFHLDMVQTLSLGLLCGITASFIEAISPYGLDNGTVQFAISGLAHWLLLK